MFKNAGSLNEYVVSTNKWRNIWGHAPLNLNSKQDRKIIADLIESELSPENLTCDGELPRSQVVARYNNLTMIKAQLNELDKA